MSDVPGEILLDIILRLPVVPLLRFRCVSKSWKCLIDSDEFIKQHLDHSKTSNTQLSIILRSSDIRSADFDLLNQTNRATFQELSHPLKVPSGGTEILGSCDGLLVLTNNFRHITLWNPSVRRFHELPYESFPILGGMGICISYGFGYDVVRDDYKLVRIVQSLGADTEVKVYSLKSDSWRRIPDFPYYLILYRSPGAFANGALHWIVASKVKSGTDTLIIAFDLGTEEYRLVPLPELAEESDMLFVLGGCLSLMFYVNDNVDIWVMNEYGVKESWSFLFTFHIPDFNFQTPIAYSKCHRKVLLGLKDRVLVWYDLDKKSTNFPMVEMPLRNFHTTLQLHTCWQSLVLLKNGTCDSDCQIRENKKGK